MHCNYQLDKAFAAMPTQRNHRAAFPHIGLTMEKHAECARYRKITGQYTAAAIPVIVGPQPRLSALRLYLFIFDIAAMSKAFHIIDTARCIEL